MSLISGDGFTGGWFRGACCHPKHDQQFQKARGLNPDKSLIDDRAGLVYRDSMHFRTTIQF
jgi:hypothetical protein